MDATTRQQVRSRAADRCEYCGLPQAAAPVFRFHVEHIHAQQHVRDESLTNLALSCPDCNRYKGPNLSSLNLETRQIVPLFNPRTENWGEHFRFHGPTIIGITLVGQVTVRLLQMNDEERLELRRELMAAGEM